MASINHLRLSRWKEYLAPHENIPTVVSTVFLLLSFSALAIVHVRFLMLPSWSRQLLIFTMAVVERENLVI